jgi:lipid-binding SYLF domain-containing protein
MTTPKTAIPAGKSRRGLMALAAGVAATLAVGAGAANAGAVSLNAKAREALSHLYATSNRSKEFGKMAVGILVFPQILKGGLLVGGMSGDGVLYEHGHVSGYYNISGASWGLQAGGEKYSYALFFMRPKALEFIHKSDGWAIGSGPSVVVVDKGFTQAGDTTTLTQDVYAMPFASKGLMGSLSLQGTKITPIHPKP